MTQTKSDRNPRGTAPPYLSLPDAFALAEKIYEHGGGRASNDLLSQLTGNSSSSSSFIRKINSLKLYGIVAEPVRGEIVLTETGMAIAAPTNILAGLSAKKDAFLRVEVFSRLFERHKGKLLPADEFLKNIIEQECRVPRDLSEQWIQAFKQGLRSAGLLHDRGDGKSQILEAPGHIQVGVAAMIDSTDSLSRPLQTLEQKTEAEPPNAFVYGHTTRIELSGKRFAFFSIPDNLTERDSQRLKKALTALSSIIDSMVGDENSQ